MISIKHVATVLGMLAGIVLLASLASTQSSTQGGGLSTRAIQGLEQCFNSSGTFICAPSGGGTPVGGSGTANMLAKFTAASTLGDSQFFDDGTDVSAAIAGELSLVSAADMNIESTGGSISIDASVAGQVLLQANTLAELNGGSARVTSGGLTELIGFDIDINTSDTGGETITIDSFGALSMNGTVISAVPSSLFFVQPTDASSNLQLSPAPAAGVGGSVSQVAGILNAMNGLDSVEVFLVSVTNADHTGAGNTLVGVDIAGIVADVDADEYALRFGAGWDRDVFDAGNLALQGGSMSLQVASGNAFAFSNGGGNIAIFNDSSDEIQFRPNLDPTFTFTDVGAGVSGFYFGHFTTLAAMNGGDIVELVSIDVTNADHTGVGNNLWGINLAIDSNDADALQSAVRVGGNWDIGIQFANGLLQPQTNILSLNGPLTFQSGTVVPIDFAMVTDFAGNDQAMFSLNTGLTILRNVGVGSILAPGVMDGSDNMSFLKYGGFTDANHLSVTNVMAVVRADTITSPDANAIHAVLRQDAGWDAMALVEAGSAWAPTFDPASNKVAIFIDEATNRVGGAGADCTLVARLANGTEVSIATLVTDGGCP